MTDQHLRELERQVAQDPSLKASWLKKRLQSGEECSNCHPSEWDEDEHDPSTCSNYRCCRKPCPRCAGLSLRERVELAAFCGDGSAREIEEGSEKWWELIDNQPLTIFLGSTHKNQFGKAIGLERWGQLVMVRAAVAAARRVLRRWMNRHGQYAYEGNRTLYDCERDAICAIEAAEAWCDCPCKKHQEVWRLASIEAMRATDTVLWLPRATQRSHDVDAIQAAVQLFDEATIRAAICKALIKWALR